MKKTEKCTPCNPLYKRVILTGPGGSGKSYLFGNFTTAMRSIKYTTRPIRSGEVHGEDYYFVDTFTYDTMSTRGLFKIKEEFNNWKYGTSKISWNSDTVFILPPCAVMEQMSKKDIEESYIVFLDIPKSTRKERLNERCDADSVERRLEVDLIDFSLFITWNLTITDPLFDAGALAQLLLEKVS